MATTKQINFIMSLLRQNGFRTDWMDKSFKNLGAGMRQRSGRVEDWVANMSRSEASNLIDTLKSARTNHQPQGSNQ